MPLRLRLTIWYGALTGVVVVAIALLAYAIHVRTHYDQVDVTLESAAEHTLEEYIRAQRSHVPFDPLSVAANPEVPVRVYGPSGDIVAATPSSQLAPDLTPSNVLEENDAVPYDRLVQLVPISLYDVDIGGGNFGLVMGEDGRRWRIVVLPMSDESGYIVAMNSLESIDTSIAGVRWLLTSIATGGAFVTLAGGWILAGRALRPVRALTDTAGAIARLRTFSRRVPVRGSDELADMSATFNLMLDELAAAYRMQQQFVSDASHELRAPLTTIQANLEFLSRQPNLDDTERRQVITETQAETNRLARLVADLLSLARADSGMQLRRETVELERLVVDVVQDVRRLAKEAQEVEIRGLDPAEFTGDPDRLKQLLIVLFDNAMKYTPRNGKIGVTLKRIGRFAEITVSDTGVGIPEADIPHIFDRFYRADPARARDPGGTGLGLSIAKWIVEAHAGSIDVHSEPNIGTTVTVRLPLKATSVLDPDSVTSV